MEIKDEKVLTALEEDLTNQRLAELANELYFSILWLNYKNTMFIYFMWEAEYLMYLSMFDHPDRNQVGTKK